MVTEVNSEISVVVLVKVLEDHVCSLALVEPVKKQ